MALFNRNSIHVCPKLALALFFFVSALVFPFFFLFFFLRPFVLFVVVVVIRVFDGLVASSTIVVVFSYVGNVKL